MVGTKDIKTSGNILGEFKVIPKITLIRKQYDFSLSLFFVFSFLENKELRWD